MRDRAPRPRPSRLRRGPVGLAAAAHVLERGMEPVVLEAGPTSATRCASEVMSQVLALGIQCR